MIIAKPITLDEANAFVAAKHRHHPPVHRDKFRVAAYDTERGEIVGVAQVGRPVARMLDDGKTLEVVRLCTDGTKNVCTFLYSRAARIAREMGYERIVTYILESEDGGSLRASGWREVARTNGGAGRGNAISITIRGYRVREWIINQVDIVGEERKNAYCNKGSEDDLPHTRWYGFHRSDNSYGGISTRQFYTSEVSDEDPNEISPREDVGRRVFLTKVSAEKYCRRVHEAQKAQLDRFNAEHGTAHEYPYEF